MSITQDQKQNVFFLHMVYFIFYIKKIPKGSRSFNLLYN
mgnify:CR=1 FL=1